MAKRKYDDNFLMPEITQAGEFQIFKMKGKDSRGFDYMVRLAAISDETYPGDIAVKADTDRVELYLGGKPESIEQVSGEVEVAIGEDGETCRINKAAMLYIPAGVPVKHRIIKQPDDIAWLLNFNLTPGRGKKEAEKGGDK